MPGVPPDAANIVKRVFKGIFKRGKKNKQDGTTDSSSASPAQQYQQQQQSQPSAAAPSSPPLVDTKAPQLPPIGNASPLSGATESSKPIPPTHPLSTGEHSTAQEAVPLQKDAEPAPGPPMGAAAAATSEATPASGGLKEPEKLGAGGTDVSPPASTMDAPDAPKSGAVSAISNEQSKTDGAVDEVPPTPTRVEESKATEDAVPPSTTTNTETTTAAAATTETSDPAAASAKENVPPVTNGTSTHETPTTSAPDAAATAPTITTAPTTNDTKSAPTDEKMPAVEEPPPIKAVRAAPGMSATSGPLEDFPEGGDAKD